MRIKRRDRIAHRVPIKQSRDCCRPIKCRWAESAKRAKNRETDINANVIIALQMKERGEEGNGEEPRG